MLDDSIFRDDYFMLPHSIYMLMSNFAKAT